MHGSGGQDDLAIRADGVLTGADDVADADGAIVAQFNACNMGVGNQREVRAAERGGQECGRGAVTTPGLLRHLMVAEALLLWAVEIGGAGVSGGDGGLDEGNRQWIVHNAVLDLHRATHPVIGVIPALVVLGGLEVRQHIRV
ncbi:MAG: hypothetical protein AAF125_14415, partial [Chloroflexota bacterium]